MSGDSSEEKTEKPSSKKLLDAHKKGQVGKSTELSTGLSLLATLLVVMSMTPWFVQHLADYFLAVERSFTSLDRSAVKALALEGVKLVGIASLLPLLVAALVFTLSMWLQTGTIFSLDPMTPKLERMNPVDGLKKLASMKSLVQFGLMLLKSAIVGGAVTLVCLRLMPDAIRVIHAGMGAALEVARVALTQLLTWCGALFVILGAADLGYQRWQFLKEMRMSMTELKRENKEQQGDGHMKAERKRAGREPSREEQLKYMSMASLVLKHSDGRLVVLIYREDVHERPLYLLRATADSAATVYAEAARYRVKQVVDDALLTALYQGVQMGVPIQLGYVAGVMAHLSQGAR